MDQTPIGVLAAGRRWGKDVGVGQNKLVAKAVQVPGGKSWCVAPGYAQVRETYENILASCPDLIAGAHLQPYPEIRWFNGHTTGFRSTARGGTLRGKGLEFLWVNEAAFVDEERFRSVLRPMVLDRGGQILLTSTFYGYNWFYDYWRAGHERTDANVRSWTYPSWTGVRFQGPSGAARLEALRAEYPGALWDQEIACKPAAKANSVFRLRDLEACTGGRPIKNPQPGRGYALGWDIGRLVDPSGWVVLDDQLRVCQAALRPLREAHESGARYCAKLKNHFRAQVVVDSTAGGKGGSRRRDQDSIVKEYRRAVRDLREWIFTDRNKRRVVEHLGVLVEKHSLRIPPQCRELYEQLANFEYTRQGDHTRYHGPDGHGDDLVAGLTMAAWAHYAGWVSRSAAGRLPASAIA